MISTLLLSGLLAQSGAQTVGDGLQTVLEHAPQELHRVYAVMHQPLTLAELAPELEGLRREQRRVLVQQRLQDHAATQQAEVLDVLQRFEAQGHARQVRSLWINNSVRFYGDEEAILAVAEVPGVQVVRYDPPRDLSEVQDVPVFQHAATPRSNGGAGTAMTTYYYEDFESGALGSEWSTTATGCGQVLVTTANGPQSGSYHMTMDSTTDSCDSSASATLSVDLTGVTTASLRFGFVEYSDELNVGFDLVEVSDDAGLTWTKVADLTGSAGYLYKIYELDGFGLTYDANFQVRFSWFDNFRIPVDGFGFDNVELADSFPPPPPPTPEDNLVKLQAPALWDLGVDGSGASILNIDSGAERSHPDLINRIWDNPADPADGIDNDSNGYTDDTWGWDFFANDNNPDPAGATHGTATGGIMVGDGSSGVFLTGMAPGASMAVARVNGEADHWEAQQWAVSVGMDCSSSSHSYKWFFSPQPDYHMHRLTEEMVMAAGVIHANSIGNNFGSSSAPVPFNISAPGLSPAPWRHPDQIQAGGGVSGVMACGGIELDDSHYGFSSEGPSAWEDLTAFEASYPHAQDSTYWDYPTGGWGLSQQGLLKPDVVTYTNVTSTTNGGGYTTFGGTSAATPHLGGALALLLAANPEALPRQVAEALQITAEDMGAAGKDNLFGAGKVQVRDAALRLMHLATALDSTPSIGTSASVQLSGPASSDYGVFYSFARGTTTIAGIGDLDIATAQLVQQGTLDASGMDTVSAPVPNNPALIGREVFVQSIVDDTAGATASYLFSLVEVLTIAP